MKKVLGGLVLSGVLLAPMAVQASDHDDHRAQSYYDSDHHDRHEWNEQEQRAYRHWMEEERHEKYRDWKHASKEQQRDYWRWRHDHPDWH